MLNRAGNSSPIFLLLLKNGKRRLDVSWIVRYFYPILRIKIINFKFTILTACLILVALLVPGTTYRSFPSFFGIDKLAHLGLFFLFSLSYSLEYKKAYTHLPAVSHAFGLFLVFVASSELLQLLTSSRHFELTDMVFDIIGASAAYIAIAFFSSGQKG